MSEPHVFSDGLISYNLGSLFTPVLGSRWWWYWHRGGETQGGSLDVERDAHQLQNVHQTTENDTEGLMSDYSFLLFHHHRRADNLNDHEENDII